MKGKDKDKGKGKLEVVLVLDKVNYRQENIIKVNNNQELVRFLMFKIRNN